MRPVYDMLTAVSARRSGHMPGHKGCSPFGAADLYALDTTELPNTDDLYAAEGGLCEAMRLYAQAAGAAKTIFLHNGSTAGNHVMLQLYARDDETVLLPRNAHLSAVNACVLGGMRVKWMPVRCTPDGYCYLAEEDVLAALRANPDARAMLLVRPDYYGGAMREDVFRRIAAAAHRQGTKVVVDEAHGAHFPWCDGMTSAGALGADAWVQSVHKTLMGLTGSAVLHLADSADEKRAWTLLRREQTSSPSFLLMLSIDDSRAWMEENGRARLRALSETVNDVRRRLVGTPYHDACAEWANLPVCFDPTRLVISAPQGGKCLAEQLREAGLDVEMADERRVVLILSVMDDTAEIRRLPELLANIPAAEKKAVCAAELDAGHAGSRADPASGGDGGGNPRAAGQSGGENRGGGGRAVSAGNPAACARRTGDAGNHQAIAGSRDAGALRRRRRRFAVRKCVIFDLDGTLTRSEEGIWNCVRYAAEKLGFPVPDAATLRKFIGPPLGWSFMEYMGMSEEMANKAVSTYRERYEAVGLFENRVYPGIRRLLRRLKRDGWYIGIATGKPQRSSERIIEHFGLNRYITKIVGPKDGAVRTRNC